jgi:hypothetical protein
MANLTVDERAALEQRVKRERVSGLKRPRTNILGSERQPYRNLR